MTKVLAVMAPSLEVFIQNPLFFALQEQSLKQRGEFVFETLLLYPGKQCPDEASAKECIILLERIRTGEFERILICGTNQHRFVGTITETASKIGMQTCLESSGMFGPCTVFFFETVDATIY